MMGIFLTSGNNLIKSCLASAYTCVIMSLHPPPPPAPPTWGRHIVFALSVHQSVYPSVRSHTSFPLNILRTIYYRVFMFHLVIGLYEDTIPIDFGFSRSKVKVTVFIYVKFVSTQYLENHLSQSLHISHGDWSL